MDEIIGESSNPRVRGTVINFLPRKGYGFIQGEDGTRLFVHYSDIRGKGYRALVTGEEVEFRCIQGSKGPQAKDVERLDPPSEEETPPPINPDRTW